MRTGCCELSPSADFELLVRRWEMETRSEWPAVRGFDTALARVLNPISCSLRSLEIAFQSGRNPAVHGT